MKKLMMIALILASLVLPHIAEAQPQQQPQTEAAQQAAPAAPAVTPDSAPAVDESRPEGIRTVRLIDVFLRGGFFMWPILLIFGGGLGFVVERFIFFRKAQLNPREFIDELESTIANDSLDGVDKLCAGRDIMLSRIIRKGLKLRSLGYEHVEKSIAIAGSIEVSVLEKGLNIVSAIGNIAPLLGFLGTVSGMINAFSAIAAADQVNARLVASGIEEALITTAFGLIVAIPMLVCYNYLVHRIDVFVADVERLSADILEKMVETNG